MFQNINETESTKDNRDNRGDRINILANIVSKKNILLYIITFMVSQVSMGYNNSPFVLAIIAASISNEIPIIAITILSLIGNIIGCGIQNTLTLFITLLVFLASFFIKEPKYNDSSKNEKVRLLRRLIISSLIVNIINMYMKQFLFYDLFVLISYSIVVGIFYKIFSNSITVLTNYNEKMAFSIEEVLGAGLSIAIALCCLGDASIFGFSVRNVLSIFIVLVLGWKNGILIGTTAGVSIGVVLGIIAENEPIVVACYAVSGMIAGILNRFGKIGVVIGFVLGNVILSYVANGLINNVILFKEILIAGIGLLVIPKNININIEKIIGDKNFLPEGSNRGLDKSKEAIDKLYNVSQAVQEMANTYKNVAATVIEEEDLKEKNKQTFISELLNEIEHIEDNILYETIEDVDGKIVEDIFNCLCEKKIFREQDLLKILAENKSYVIGINENDEKIEKDIRRMTEKINSAFRIGKMNFIYKEKIKEEKKNIEKQLDGVSKAISNIAEDFNKELSEEESFQVLKEQIVILLKQKNIFVNEIHITKNGRYNISLYIDNSSTEEIEENVEKVLEKVLKEKIEFIEKNEIKNDYITKYVYRSADKFILDIGHSIAVKDGMPVSGDCIIQTKLKDGKVLIGISDGMGSGPEARKSSQIVISMLKRLLNSGFEKDTSIDLINSSLLNVGEDTFATLDIAIIDLYMGNIEFIKNGACPTYIKSSRRIQIIKSLTLPTGVIKESRADIFDKDIENQDIILMCSDGILDSNVEYKNKELWLKYLLEDINITNSQKISDIVLNEAIDNNYGKVKDDMSVIVFKCIKKI